MTDDRGQREDLVCAGFGLVGPRAGEGSSAGLCWVCAGLRLRSSSNSQLLPRICREIENKKRETREQREYETTRRTWDKKGGLLTFCGRAPSF